jgi:hypothetical protein
VAKKSFRMPRQTRPPEEFEIVFEVREQEKVNVGTEEAPAWEMHDITPETWVEEKRGFSARMTDIPGGIAFAAMSPPKGDDDIEGAARWSQALRDVLRITVVERDEFEELLDSPRTLVPLQGLFEIVSWVMEEAGQRPTTGPARS